MPYETFVKISSLPDTFCAVLNLDDKTGTHYVAVYNEAKSSYAEYFDSFGMPPPDLVIEYLQKKTGKEVRFNVFQVQADLSSRCAFYCIYFIKKRASGQSFEKVMSHFTLKPSKKNEELVIS